jgi:hypothetical protein
LNWKNARGASALLLLLGAATFLHAQTAVQVGSRRAGMAGAGLALPDDVLQTGRVNPAAFAYARAFRLGIPTIGYQALGLSLRQIRDEIDSIGAGGFDPEGLADFARRFGDEEKRFGVNGSLAAAGAGLGFGFGGEVSVTTIPNEPLQAWVAAGAEGIPPEESRLDGFGYGYGSLDLGYGQSHALESGELAVGVRVRAIQTYFSHHFSDREQIQAGTGSARAPELAAEDTDVLSRRGLGADLGALFTPAATPDVHYAFVAENALRPRVGFDGTDPLGNPLRVDPFQTAFSGGVSWRAENVVYVADIVDMGNRAGRSALQFGAEYRVTPQFALRAGYSSRDRMAVGLSFAGIEVAVSRETPLLISTGLRF